MTRTTKNASSTKKPASTLPPEPRSDEASKNSEAHEAADEVGRNGSSKTNGGGVVESPTLKAQKAASAAKADRYILKDGSAPVDAPVDGSRARPCDNAFENNGLEIEGARGADEPPAEDEPDVEVVPEEVIRRLAELSEIEFYRQQAEMADLLGVPKAALKRAVMAERRRLAIERARPPLPTLSDAEIEASAKPIIDCDNVLGLFEKAWNKVMAGERKNAKLLYLMATSRLFDKCMSGAIKGPSGAGKSELRHRVLDFFPPEHVVSFTTLSDKALLYFTEDFTHKVLSMGEAGGAEEQSLQDYLLRELMSEGKLRYPVVQKVAGGNLETVIVEKNGPVVFFVTTTKEALHQENETRMLSLEVDDSERQTKFVIAKVAEIVGLNAESATVDYEPWRNYQRHLASGNCAVVVPFASELGQLIPGRSVRLRRDFSQILLAIKAHALLHRNFRQVDSRGQIIASVQLDYRPVAELMAGIVAEASGTAISEEMLRTTEMVKVATVNRAVDDGATAFEIGKLLKLDKSTALRRLRVAVEKGFVVNLETRKGQPGRYRLSEHEVEMVELLPTPEAILEMRKQDTAQPAQPCNPELED